ncbi:MAG: DUF1080 domain-containing protein [Planctomycetes bacterium]|nr:DUF1080 domain-containing protein [Planctomycetota bacterium]
MLGLAWGGLAAHAEEGKFVRIFNGKDLAGWKGNTDHWSVRDGAITGQTTADKVLKHNTFVVYQEGLPADFELKLQYRIVGGNSGIQYRSKVIDAEKFIVGGYQADIDSNPRFSGINYDERGRGVLAERGQAVRIAAGGEKETIGSLGDRDALQAKIKNEDWNEYRIVAKGNHLQHFINGVLMSEVIDEQGAKSAAKGVIALQLHQGPPMVVQFKDIELMECP